MLLADVTKIKCKFVTEWIAFLNKRKYSVSACSKCKYTYYADALKVLYGGVEDDPNFTSDCLDHDIECDLTTKANKYPEATTDCASGTLCLNQVSITLAEVGTSCTTTAGLSTSFPPTFGTAAYPATFVTDNSSYINGTVYKGVQGTSSCAGSGSTQITGGCTSGGCSNTHKAQYYLGFRITQPLPASTTYIKSLRIHYTDSLGTLVSYIDLDLEPGSIYYSDNVSCPGCSAVLGSEVQFGNANFGDAFETLMDNVSIALFGSPSLHGITAASLVSVPTITSTAVHNPASYWFGIHYPNARLVLSNNSVYTTINWFGPPTSNINKSTPIRFYSADSSFVINNYDCAELNVGITDQAVYPRVDLNQSSFNKIVLFSTQTYEPLTIPAQSTTCSGATTLTASYTTTGTVTDVV